MGGGGTMPKYLGEAFLQLREEYKISQEKLCNGLCSVATLSRIELGEREPDYLLFDALLTRLGKDSQKFDLILEEQDRELLIQRNDMEYLFYKKRWEELEEKVREYSDFKGISEHLQRQYRSLWEGRLLYEKQRYEEAIEVYQAGLNETKCTINFWDNQVEGRTSRNELRLLCFIGQAVKEIEEWSFQKKEQYLRGLLSYIQVQCTDKRYGLPYETMAEYSLAKLYVSENKVVESILYCKSGIERLIKMRSTYYLKQFLQLIEQLKQKAEIVVNNMIPLDNIPYLLEILEEWKHSDRDIEEKERALCHVFGVSTMGEIIKNTRKYWKLSQRDMIDTLDGSRMIIDQAGLSQIERGKREPRKKIVEYCFQKLEIQGKENRFVLPIDTDSFTIQEMRWEIEDCIAIHRKDKVKELFEQIKDKIDQRYIYNLQWCERIKMTIEESEQKISLEEYREKIIDLLKLTVPNIETILEKEGDWSCYFTQQELRLLMSVAYSYHMRKQYDISLEYSQKLVNYYKKYYPMAAGRIYRLMLFNLSSVSGLLGNYEDAMKYAKESIELDNFFYEFNSVAQCIFNIGWCYGKKMLEESQKEKKEEYRTYCKRYFRQASYLAKLYEDEEIWNAVERCCKEWKID